MFANVDSWKIKLLSVSYYSSSYSQPNFDGKWVHKGEETRGFPTGYFEQDGDAEVHEGFREVYDSLAGKVDGHCPNGDVGIAVDQF